MTTIVLCNGFTYIKGKEDVLLPDLDRFEKTLLTINKKLNNSDFMTKANPLIVQETHKKRIDLETKISDIKTALKHTIWKKS